MARTLDKGRLRDIRVTGRGLRSNVVEACSSASFSLANDQVTELSLTINDSMDLDLFRSGLLAAGSTVTYGDWTMTTDTMSVTTGPIGPQLSVTAVSRAVTRLRGQTGGKNWGESDVSAWATDRIRSSGAKALVQPGLGKLKIARKKPDGDQKESTWDVMVDVAGRAGAWLFEHGQTMVFARPEWLVRTNWARRDWNIHWNDWFDYDRGIAGMPQYSKDPNGDPVETLKVRLVSADADRAAPGDRVDLSGNVGDMRGRWIVTGVEFPFTVAGAVTLNCERPKNPERTK